MESDLIPSYAVLTPVGNHKTYSVIKQHDYLKRLINPPSEVIYAIDSDLEDKQIIYNLQETVLEVDQDPDHIIAGAYRVAKARETLRKYFLNTDNNWAFYVDSDMYVPSTSFIQLWNYAIKNRLMMVIHTHPEVEHTHNGYSCAIIHRRLMYAARHYVIDFSFPNEHHKYALGEEHGFLALFASNQWYEKHLKVPFFRGIGREVIFMRDLAHEHIEGDVKYLWQYDERGNLKDEFR
jgi:hypothetical protein